MRGHPPSGVRWVRFLGSACILACLTSHATFAAEPEREIPVARDRSGSRFDVDISRDGTRHTATPVVSIAEPSVSRVEAQIERRIGIELGLADAVHKTAASAETTDGDITARDVRCLFRAIRATIKARRTPSEPSPAESPGTSAKAAPDDRRAERHTAALESPPFPAGRN